MKLSKKAVRCRAPSIPEIRFEEQDLTSFGGLVIFQKLFEAIGLKRKLRECVRHVNSSSSYGLGTVLLLLVTHLMLGWRRLRDLDYYRDDPIVKRTLGLSLLPNVSTVTRALRSLDLKVVDKLRTVCRELALRWILGLSRLTLDFDGTVVSTKSRSTEGTAIGYNRKAKGCRSYYPLMATLAQTGQVFDVLHRPGNVHDSRGALAFIQDCVEKLRSEGFRGRLEVRLDGAHFSDTTCHWLDDHGVEFSVSVPFERLTALKQQVRSQNRWKKINREWSYAEVYWTPKSWERFHRCVIFRHRVKKPRKGPIQLDLFEPLEPEYEYKVVMTNKKVSARALLEYHNGRGSQESVFAELKTGLNLDYIPTRRLVPNQAYLLCAVLAHNMGRHLQMIARPPSRNTNLRRAALWVFDKFDSLRKRIIQRAARLTRPHGTLTLTMAGNKATEREFRELLSALDHAA